MPELRQDLAGALGAPYSVERELGGGGMSRVFVALETSLGRRIVIKVLPVERASRVSVERFHREIMLAARLQHPHIVPLLQTGEVDGLPYYTMPFVTGESLRARLQREGELSVSDAIRVLRDVAAALAYAHGEGVVHRDIKPDNVMLSGGVAVVTDFGVAKALQAATAGDGGENDGLTSLGVALGTPAYMSPEQASADPHIDHRADIYSFGVMAYEMLCGVTPFANRPTQQILASHVTELPGAIEKRRPQLPPPLASLVMRCLEKRASDRPQSADEIMSALDAIGTSSGGISPTGVRAPVRIGLRRGLVAAAGAIAVVALLGFMWLTRPEPGLTIGNVTQVTRSSDALSFDASISPDGRFVAYAAGPAGAMRIFVRQVAASSTLELSKDVPGDHRWPRWSPKGDSIVFAASNRIYAVPALSGAPKLLAESGDMPSWSPDGKSIAFVRDDGVWLLNLATSALRRLDTAFYANSPSWSPDGRRIAFVKGNAGFIGLSRGGENLYGNASASSVWVVDTSGAGARLVSDESHLNTSPAWLPGGSALVYVSERDGVRDIYEQRLDQSGAPRGAPERLTTGANAFTVTVSRDGGVLAYSTLLLRSNIWSAPVLDRLAPSSSLRQITNGKQDVEGLSISHDSRCLAFDSNVRGTHNIYKIAVDGGDSRGEPVTLTTDSTDAFAPRWSPGDSELVFHALTFGTRDLFTVRADGQGRTRVTKEPGQEFSQGWSPDGRSLVYSSPISGHTGRRIFVVSRTGSGWGMPRPVSDSTDTLITGAHWSPDGTALGMDRDNGVWLMPLNGGALRLVVSKEILGESATSMVWLRDGRGIVLQTRDSVGIFSFWKADIDRSHKPVRLLRLDEPNRRTRRVEFDTDGRSLFFTIAADEADVVVATLRRK